MLLSSQHSAPLGDLRYKSRAPKPSAAWGCQSLERVFFAFLPVQHLQRLEVALVEQPGRPALTKRQHLQLDWQLPVELVARWLAVVLPPDLAHPSQPRKKTPKTLSTPLLLELLPAPVLPLLLFLLLFLLLPLPLELQVAPSSALLVRLRPCPGRLGRQGRLGRLSRLGLQLARHQ